MSVKKKVLRITKEVRALKKTQTETFEEQDIELREMKDFAKSIDKMLTDILDTNPDLNAVLPSFFQQVQLPTGSVFLMIYS